MKFYSLHSIPFLVSLFLCMSVVGFVKVLVGLSLHLEFLVLIEFKCWHILQIVSTMFMSAYFGNFQCSIGFFCALFCLLVVLVLLSSNLARD